MQAYILTPPGLSSIPTQFNLAERSKSPLPALRPSVYLSDPLSLLSDEQALGPRKPTATTVFTLPPPKYPSNIEASIIYIAVPATVAATATTSGLDAEVPMDIALITPFPTRAVTFTRSSNFRVTEGSKKLWKLAALNVCTARHRAAVARRVQERLEAEAKEREELEKEKERMRIRSTVLQDLKNLAGKPRQPSLEGREKQGEGNGSEVEMEFVITPIRMKSATPITQAEPVHVRRRAKDGSIKLRKLAAANTSVQKHRAAMELARKEAEKARSAKKENRVRENRTKLAVQISIMAEDSLAARAGSRRSRRQPAPTMSTAGVAIMA